MPGTYTTAALVVEAYSAGHLRGALGLGAAVDPATNDALLSAVDSANSEVDAHLRGRYALPLTDDPPPFLVSAATDIAYYTILRRTDALVSDADERRVEHARRTLRDISRGIMGLDVGDSGAEHPAASVARSAVVQIGANVPDNADPGVRARSIFNQDWYRQGRF